MSKRDWLNNSTLAIVSCAAFLATVGMVAGIVYDQRTRLREGYAEYQKTAERDRQQAANKIYQSCSWITVESARKDCVVRELDAAATEDAGNKDLQAQQDMAYWAGAVFWAACFQILFSGIGIYWLIRAFNQTNSAIKLSAESLAESRKANIMSALFSSTEQGARQAELRAYICVTNAEKNTVLSSDEDYFGAVTFKNFGQTPAYDVIIRRGIDLFSKKIIENDGYGVRETADTDPAVVGPDQPFQASARFPLSQERRATLKNGDYCLVLYGEIEYVDVMKTKRSTMFNLVLVDFGGKTERFTPRGKFNDAT